MVKILFLHPDMGIGGAERLVIDAALAFTSKGHEVTIYSNHFDPDHCFDQLKQDTIPLRVVGNWFPRAIFGRFKALCAAIRMIIAALYLTLFVVPVENPKLIFCDLVPHCIPFLKLVRGHFKVVLYCHFPDKLLTSEAGPLKKLYRYPINWFEEVSTSCADVVLVNSNFTAQVFRNSFHKITSLPKVCYPSINADSFQNVVISPLLQNFSSLKRDGCCIFLSINRFARQKNLTLALKALKKLKNIVNKNSWNRVHLIMAGGFDSSNNENIQHYSELKDVASKLEIEDKVTLMKSPTDAEKRSLLQCCNALIYTPINEHFGITPLEAMYFSKPVIAVNSGGPKETIVNNITGFLCEANSESFVDAMSVLVNNPEQGKRLGAAGKKRLETEFSFETFSENINRLIAA